MVALVFDAPSGAEAVGRTVFNGNAGEVMAATLRAVIRAAGGTSSSDVYDDVAVFHAVTRPVPGGKPPKVVPIRACHARLLAELDAAEPRMVVSVGAAAAGSLSGT